MDECLESVSRYASWTSFDYVTLFFDLDARKLIFGTEGRDNATVKEFVADLKAHGGAPENISRGLR